MQGGWTGYRQPLGFLEVCCCADVEEVEEQGCTLCLRGSLSSLLNLVARRALFLLLLSWLAFLQWVGIIVVFVHIFIRCLDKLTLL